MAVEASAPGKVILFGDHSVVYRGPAVALAIDRRAYVVAEERADDRVFMEAADLGVSGYFHGDTYHPLRGGPTRGRGFAALNLAVRRTLERIGAISGVSLSVYSEIPTAVGLGSSAALCVAAVASVGALRGGGLPREEVCALAYEGERLLHGRPSGVDNNVSTYGGVLRYERGIGFERFDLDSTPTFVVGNTRRRRSTRRMVEGVRALRERNPSTMDSIIDALGEAAREGLAHLRRGDLGRTGDLMNISHGLLAALGVSSPELDALVHASRRAGALGAKLTGAGGGGCMIALVGEAGPGRVEGAIARAGGEPLRVGVSYEGVSTRRV